MRVYMNFNEVRGPYGGANSFLRTLREGVRGAGIGVTNDVRADVDVAFLNALTDGIDLDFVRGVAERGIPIVHRKVGYAVSGSPEMRAIKDGVVHGDRLQVEFSPYLAHTIFQSAYSRDVFLESGFDGAFSVIHNGVDERVFNLVVASRLGRRGRRRTFWRAPEPLRVIISTWSPDPNKGFPEFEKIDRALADVRDVELSLVGQKPDGVEFTHIRHLPPRPARRLAVLLKDQHVLLHLARLETCSNALIEGINCGLPPIYLDSGSNEELATECGVRYDGDFFAAVEAVRDRYDGLVARCAENPYRLSTVLPRYLDVLEAVATGARAA
jgi:glycosyltransferase involved in cell wall biosynthesis